MLAVIVLFQCTLGLGEKPNICMCSLSLREFLPMLSAGELPEASKPLSQAPLWLACLATQGWNVNSLCVVHLRPAAAAASQVRCRFQETFPSIYAAATSIKLDICILGVFPKLTNSTRLERNQLDGTANISHGKPPYGSDFPQELRRHRQGGRS